MNRFPTTIALLLALAVPASADPGIRQHGASARTLGCTPLAPGCDGVTTSRAGISVIDLLYGLSDRFQLVGMFQASGRPDVNALVESQVLAGPGLRITLSRFWIQAGVGVGASRRAAGPKSITAMQVLEGAEPAVLGGVGMALGDNGLILALDGSAAFDTPTTSRVHQVSANLSRPF